MKVFSSKAFRRLFGSVLVSFIVISILLQVIVYVISEDYKKQLIEHDYKLAGYLCTNSLKESQIKNAFIAEKSEENFQAGKELLQKAGYDDNTKESLILEVYNLRSKYSVIIFMVSVAAASLILGIILIFNIFENNKIDKASEDIMNFMQGRLNIRLVDNEEGSLYKLFSSINIMATSLTVHITKEKENKEFLRDTISDISHQLKTPLAALKMYNEIIEEEDIKNEVVKKFVMKSCNELNRIEVLIQNLLKLAKLDANSIQLDKKQHNLKAFLGDIISGFHTRAEIEEKSLFLQCAGDIRMNFDIDWLLEAISNIIKNALDHTEANSKIYISCNESSVMTQIIIKDDGKGIHPEDIQYIFKRFYRSRFSKDSQGIGIGLTLAKSIIEKHGGSIVVESELGKGSTFYISFPKLLTNL